MMNAAQGGYYTEGRTVVPFISGRRILGDLRQWFGYRRRMGIRRINDIRRRRCPPEPRSAGRKRPTNLSGDEF